MGRDKHLDDKLDEVIRKGSITEYLGNVFSMFAFECGVENKDRKEIYNGFIEEFGDICGDLINSGMDNYNAKHTALYNITQKYLPQNNLKKPSHFY